MQTTYTLHSPLFSNQHSVGIVNLQMDVVLPPSSAAGSSKHLIDNYAVPASRDKALANAIETQLQNLQNSSNAAAMTPRGLRRHRTATAATDASQLSSGSLASRRTVPFLEFSSSDASSKMKRQRTNAAQSPTKRQRQPAAPAPAPLSAREPGESRRCKLREEVPWSSVSGGMYNSPYYLISPRDDSKMLKLSLKSQLTCAAESERTEAVRAVVSLDEGLITPRDILDSRKKEETETQRLSPKRMRDFDPRDSLLLREMNTMRKLTLAQERPQHVCDIKRDRLEKKSHDISGEFSSILSQSFSTTTTSQPSPQHHFHAHPRPQQHSHETVPASSSSQRLPSLHSSDNSLLETSLQSHSLLSQQQEAQSLWNSPRKSKRRASPQEEAQAASSQAAPFTPRLKPKHSNKSNADENSKDSLVNKDSGLVVIRLDNDFTLVPNAETLRQLRKDKNLSTDAQPIVESLLFKARLLQGGSNYKDFKPTGKASTPYRVMSSFRQPLRQNLDMLRQLEQEQDGQVQMLVDDVQQQESTQKNSIDEKRLVEARRVVSSRTWQMQWQQAIDRATMPRR